MDETPDTPKRRPNRRTTGRTTAPASQRHAAPAGPKLRPPLPPDSGALTWRDTPGYDAMVAAHGDPFARDEDAEKAGAVLSQQIAEARSWVEGTS